MGEIKNKLNISKITIKNLFLVILLMAVMVVIGVIAKSIGGGVAQTGLINSASADFLGGGGGCESESSSSSGSAASDAICA